MINNKDKYDRALLELGKAVEQRDLSYWDLAYLKLNRSEIKEDYQAAEYNYYKAVEEVQECRVNVILARDLWESTGIVSIG